MNNTKSSVDKKVKARSKLEGIDGWLILIASGLILSISGMAIAIFDLLVNHISIFNDIGTLNLLVILLNFFSLLSYIFLFTVMFKKLYFFPNLYFIIMLVLYFLNLLILILTSSLNLFVLAIVPVMIIWIIYIKKSKRVHNTFIYGWNGEIIKKQSSSEQPE